MVENMGANLKKYDAIVLGLGGMGSAALYHLSKENINVAGIDRFNPPHENGSSHGDTRIYRQLYMENPEYVNLLLKAETAWEEIEQVSQSKLFHRCDTLSVGDKNSRALSGALHSAREYGLNYQVLNAKETAARYPFLQLSENHLLCVDPKGGILEPEKCIDAHLKTADKQGADIFRNTPVSRIIKNENGYEIETPGGSFFSEKLIVTAGGWTAELLPEMKKNLAVTRRVLTYLKITPEFPSFEGIIPNLMIEDRDEFIYSIFSLDGKTIKGGIHLTEMELLAQPDSIDWEAKIEESAFYTRFLKRFIPKGIGEYVKGKVCFYTVTLDEDFIVEKDPTRGLVYACGFSGHGFKFCSALGQVLADLAMEKEPACSVDFLSSARFDGKTNNRTSDKGNFINPAVN